MERMVYGTGYESPVGRLTLASEGESLTGLWIEGQKYELGGLKERPVRRDDLPVFVRARAWLDRYFAGERPEPAQLPLRPEGSAFRKRIWRYLLEIPYGEVTTYKALAERAAWELSQEAAYAAAGADGGCFSPEPFHAAVNMPADPENVRPSGGQISVLPAAGPKAAPRPRTMSAQAVGGAVGHNPISIIIPCHRVVGSDGSLTGYAGGLDVKRRLLELEGVSAEALRRRIR